MTEFRVSNWVRNFENSKTKELKRLEWVPVPNKMDGAGYTELVDHPNGASHLGAWLAILEIASKQDIRGDLPTASTGTAAALARISRLPISLFEEVLPRLSAIGWIDDLTQQNQQPDGIRRNPSESVGNPPLKGNGIEWNGREEKTPSCSPAEAVAPANVETPSVRAALEATEKLKTPKQAKPEKVTNIASGTRISVEELPDEWANWALTDCAMDRQQAQRVFAEFRDYWLSIPGAKGRKADWFATWRNRCRNLPSSRDDPKTGTLNFYESATDRAIRVGKERILNEGRL